MESGERRKTAMKVTDRGLDRLGENGIRTMTGDDDDDDDDTSVVAVEGEMCFQDGVTKGLTTDLGARAS